MEKEHISRRDLFKTGVAGALGLVVGRALPTKAENNDLNDVRAQAQVAYRQGVDAERMATVIFLGVTGQKGSPYTLEQYRELFNDAVDRAGKGEDSMSTGFWKNAEPEPTPTPTEVPNE